MANEELTIAKEKARLTVIGNSYPDVLTDSGFGFDIPELIVDALDELGIELPDWGPTVPPDLIIGLDPDTGIPTLEYPDPEWEEPEWPDPDISDHDWPEPDWPDNDLPDIIRYPLPDLDWDDFIDELEDLDIAPDILKDLSFVGLNDFGIPTLVSLDEDFNIQKDELPTSIEIVTMPNKLEYQDGERIDLTGMVVTAKKADGSTWTSAKYPNGHIPLGELVVSPLIADVRSATEKHYAEYEGVTIPWASVLIAEGIVSNKHYIASFTPEDTEDHPTRCVWLRSTSGDNYLPLLTHRAYPSDSLYYKKSPYLRWTYSYDDGTVQTGTGELSGNSYWADYPAATLMYYQTIWSGGYYNNQPVTVVSDLTGQNIGKVLWAGEQTIKNVQSIFIGWSRPSDKIMLITSFEIEVIAGGGGR